MKKVKSKVQVEPRQYQPTSEGLEDGEVRIQSIKPGHYCLLGTDQLLKVLYHAAGSTAIEKSVHRKIITRNGEEADITGNSVRRVALATIVRPLTDLEVAAFLNGVAAKRTTANKVMREKSETGSNSVKVKVTATGVGIRSMRDLDDAAKEVAKKYITENKLTYKEIRDRVAQEIKGWDRSPSWVSNLAFYMRKESNAGNMDR